MTERRLTLALGALAVVGVAISGYLTWVHYADAEALCLASGGCEKVQQSRYSELAGVPVAVLGLAGYLAILGTLALRGDTGRLLTAFLAFGGVAFTAYLTYVELFEIEAVCQWCVASAVVITIIAVLAGIRVWRGAPSAGAAVVDG